MVLHHCPHVQYLSCVFGYRQRRKDRKQQRRLQRQNHHQEEEDRGEAHSVRKRPRREVTSSSLKLVVDCSFDNLMLIKVNSSGTSCGGVPSMSVLRYGLRFWLSLFCLQDVRKLHKQIQRCYAENRRSSNPVQVSEHRLTWNSRDGPVRCVTPPLTSAVLPDELGRTTETEHGWQGQRMGKLEGKHYPEWLMHWFWQCSFHSPFLFWYSSCQV